MHRHGWQLPLDPYQVGSFVMFAVLISGFYAFFLPFVDAAPARWVVGSLYTALVVFIVGLNLVTSGIDPSDPGLSGSSDGEFYCSLCQASVCRSSKHCRACDRCVDGFDHHCKWLNNCIGAANYRHFFVLVSGTCSMLGVQLGCGIWLFARSFYNSRDAQASLTRQYGHSVNYRGWQASLAIYMLLLAASVIMLGELLFFHIVLVSKGMTTYDYIVSQREQHAGHALSVTSSRQPGLCHAGRVVDSSALARPQRAKVSLNPCAAIKTQRQPGIGQRSAPAPLPPTVPDKATIEQIIGAAGGMDSGGSLGGGGGGGHSSCNHVGGSSGVGGAEGRLMQACRDCDPSSHNQEGRQRLLAGPPPPLLPRAPDDSLTGLGPSSLMMAAAAQQRHHHQQWQQRQWQHQQQQQTPPAASPGQRLQQQPQPQPQQMAMMGRGGQQKQQQQQGSSPLRSSGSPSPQLPPLTGSRQGASVVRLPHPQPMLAAVPLPPIVVTRSVSPFGSGSGRGSRSELDAAAQAAQAMQS